jgi:pimeloyl-ACP methyl ester carboxylesterase
VPGQKRLRLVVLLVAGLLVGACGGQTPKPRHVAGLDGSIVEVDDHYLYFECFGHGSPTVLLEAGFGGDTGVWDAVQPELAKTTRTCSYARAGLGGSSEIPGVHDADDEIHDLEQLLDRAEIASPYVLVGHSYGGLLVRMFAARHRKDVAGVVLVDSSHPEQETRDLAALPQRPSLTRLRRDLRLPRVLDGVAVRRSFALAGQVRSLGDLRLLVITAGQQPVSPLPSDVARQLATTWLSLQDELARLSDDSVHIIALHSEHFVQSFGGQPDLVIRGVRIVVRAARDERPLPSCARLFHGPGVRCV